MRRTSSAILVLLAMCGCSPTTLGSSSTNAAELEDANRREVAAFLAVDAVALEQLWRDDFIVTNPLNQVATKSEVLQMVREGFLTFRSYERRPEHTRFYGDVAVIVGSEDVEWTGRMPLAGRPVRLRYTAVWRHTDGRWRQVVRHANVVP